MPLKTEGIDEPELNLTPMIDIVFLLIIFFLVGTEFAEDKSVEERMVESVEEIGEKSTLLPIELPTSSSQSSLTPGPDPVVVSITKDGGLYVNEKQVTSEELQRDLKAAKKNYDDTAVIIAGDGEADLQTVVDVLRICEVEGIKRTRLKAKTVDLPGL